MHGLPGVLQHIGGMTPQGIITQGRLSLQVGYPRKIFSTWGNIPHENCLSGFFIPGRLSLGVLYHRKIVSRGSISQEYCLSGFDILGRLSLLVVYTGRLSLRCIIPQDDSLPWVLYLQKNVSPRSIYRKTALYPRTILSPGYYT